MPHTMNFLEQIEPEEVREVRKRRRIGKRIAIAVIILVLLYAVGGVVFAGRVVARALDGKEAVDRAEKAVYDLDFDEAKEQLRAAEIDFAQAKAGLWFFSVLRPLPWVGDQLKGVGSILEAGEATVATLGGLLDIAEDVLRLAAGTEALVGGLGGEEGLSWSELPPETKKAVILRFASSASDLELAKVEIGLILRDLEELPEGALAEPLRDILDPFVEQLVALENTLDALIPVAFVLPSFAGLDHEQHLLLLFLNNAELRPGGGFIGSYGIVSFRDAEMTGLETHDVMDIDGPAMSFHKETPPEPIREYMGVDSWYFRDSNWSPDFAVSTENGLRLFHAETADAPAGVSVKQPYVSFDAVIGLTPTFVSDLLEIVGPISLDGQTFSASNILTTLEYAVEYGFVEAGVPAHQRKEIIGDLAEVVKERLFDLPAGDWDKVFSAIGRALREKQLVIYSSDPTSLEVIARKDWAGRVFPGSVDTLMVVDANLAALKTDTAVHRTIDYSIAQSSEGRYVARVDITYDHQGTFDWKTTRYRTFTRVYVPLGSTFISASGTLANDKLNNPGLLPDEVVVGEELDLTVFGAFTSIEPGETRTLTFEYLLPESVSAAIDDGVYELDVVKQIGAAPHELNLELDFDKKISGAYPGEQPEEYGDDKYILNTEIDQNLKFVVEL